MIISHQHRFIYFGPPRTGSSSLSKLFVEQFNAEVLFRPECDTNSGRFLTELGRAQHQICLPAAFSNYLTILSVRDPYSRFLSMYAFFKARHGCQSIREYFSFAHPPVTQELEHKCPHCVAVRVDHVIRLDNLQQDVDGLPFIVSHVKVPHENESAQPLHPLTDEVIQFVERFYSQDFLTFGYALRSNEMEMRTGAVPPLGVIRH
jgi:hypothetical protein